MQKTCVSNIQKTKKELIRMYRGILLFVETEGFERKRVKKRATFVRWKSVARFHMLRLVLLEVRPRVELG